MIYGSSDAEGKAVFTVFIPRIIYSRTGHTQGFGYQYTHIASCLYTAETLHTA